MRASLLQVFVFVFLSSLATASCTRSSSDSITYVTEYGLGPDKWATAWLLTQRPGARAALRVIDSAAIPDGAISFDVPGAPIRRMKARAAFEVAADALQLQEPVLKHLAAIVHRIEVDFWSSDDFPEADIVEAAYRTLQLRHGRDQVSANCYVAFFDRVYKILQDMELRGVEFDADRLGLDCEELIQVAGTHRQLIPEVPVADVLSAMAAGRRVVFVDVREADEFAEAHIPGALNVPLREARSELAARFAGADYVVSYCVKDFRGFEMAKALANAGVKNSVIMRPYGIKGWVALGLPVTGDKALAEPAALADLEQCLRSRGQCLSERRTRGETS